MPKSGRAPHHDGSYRKRARLVTLTAASDPDTTCWRCGKTLTAHKRHKNGRAPFWTAGHIVEGDGSAGLRAEASVCNFAAGAAYGNALRANRPDSPEPRITQWWGKPEPHSEDWTTPAPRPAPPPAPVPVELDPPPPRDPYDSDAGWHIWWEDTSSR